MKNKVLIVKNITREGPGILGETLSEKNIDFDKVDLSKGENFSFDDKYRAVIVLGGPQSANDDTYVMRNEIEQIRQVLKNNIPYLGICLGFQILVKAAGGKVNKCQVKEVGFRDPENNYFTIELTGEGKFDPLFAGLTNSFKVFQLHGETVDLTDNIKLLATGKFCINQIVKFGSFAYGIQNHFELTAEMFDEWIREDLDLLTLNKNQLRNDFRLIKDEYDVTGKRLFKNFLEIAGF